MFEEIKEKYPKVWKMFNEFYYSINTNRLTTKYIKAIEIHAIVGDLFKFFDEQGICINISGWIHEDDPYYEYEIFTDGQYVINSPNFQSRQEAWKSAFIKAFELLEKR